MAGVGCHWSGVYLLIDNDSGGSVGYLYLSQQSVVKPDSDNEGGSEKGSGGCQGCS